ncbi:MAG: branched-chain amino acid ABC transporter ATP-binding protein/permease [Candidatus Tectomicrobia bacterium]|uniref:Branched-chain amino acid ABC transporter ATP-binding protein/permease n=1 Tax=Tectimicrobiota bacterium TaxID=2528274 RepID=A0A933LPW7_UNCTE|nr:branched-chain amino acid ABC transporter ATP-binding protein/permease [Candidatus Tectomicrobia bacterium]
MEYLIHILIFIIIWTILGISYNIVIGYTGLLTLAHAAFFGVGAYVTALLSIKLGTNFLLAMAVGVLFASLLGAVVAIPSLRVGGDYLLVLSFGFQMVAYGVMTNWTRVTGGEGGIPGIPKPEFLGLKIISNRSFLLLTLLFGILCFLFSWWLTRSPFGRALKATREDELAAQACGKDVKRLKIWSFVIGGGIASISGSLFAHYMTFINPGSFTLHEAVFILAIVIVGGMSNLWGTILGSIILITLPELLRFIHIPGTMVGPLRSLIYGSLLILFMLFRPQGMIPEYSSRPKSKVKIREKFDPSAKRLFTTLNSMQKAEGEFRAEQDGNIIELHGIVKSFGGLMAVQDLNLSIPRGKITGLVGPNGAGKTTAFNLITGFLRPDKGSVYMNGEQISHLPPYKIARKGLGRSFQDLKLFNRLPVIDNVLLSIPHQKGEKLRALFCNPVRVFKEDKGNFDKAMEYLNFIGLADKAFVLAEDLSFAEKKLLAIARLLATEAEFLLLDEPATGLDPHSIIPILELIKKLTNYGKTICIIEHNLDVIKNTADLIIFMANGTVIASGPPDTVMSDRKLAEIYFGL